MRFYRLAILIDEMLEEAAGGVLHQVEHELESARAAIVGIGNFFQLRGTREIQKQCDLRLCAIRINRLEVTHVLLIHDKDVIEFEKIFRPHLARLKPRKIVTTPDRGLLGALIRRIAFLIIASAGGIGFNLHRQSRFLNHVAKHTLRRGRATNISHANKQYLNHGLMLIHNERKNSRLANDYFTLGVAELESNRYAIANKAAL